MLSHKELKARALARPDVKAEYDKLEEEFALLDEFLKARAAAGFTQAEVRSASAPRSLLLPASNPATAATRHRLPPFASMPVPLAVVLNCASSRSRRQNAVKIGHARADRINGGATQ